MAQTERETDRHTDGHGDSLTNSAQWGRVGENGKTNIYAKSPLKCETLTYLFSTSLELGLQTELDKLFHNDQWEPMSTEPDQWKALQQRTI